MIVDHQGMEIIPMKEVRYNDMKLILDFVYFGEVDVSHTDVSSLIETARLLQIPSLSVFSQTFSEKHTATESQPPNEILSKDSVQNNSVTKIDMINEGTENFQDDLFPFTFVAVSPYSVKSEHVDDELNASSGNLSEMENPLEAKPVNSDTTNERKREREFQSQPGVKIESEEEDSVHGNDVYYEATEMNCFAEGMNDLQMDFESVSDIVKCELSEGKAFETASDNESVDDNNDLLTSNEKCESIKCDTEMIHKNSAVLERINSCSEMTVGNNYSDFEDFCKSSRTVILPINKENELENIVQDLDSSQCVSASSEIENQDTLTLNNSVHFSESLENMNCSRKNQVRQNHNSSGLKRLSCNVCEKSFNGSNTLKKHMLIHAGEKLFLCDVCNSPFRSRDALMLHMRSHSGEKRYNCVICGSTFTLNCNLKTHMRIHNRERPYKCDICEATFSQKASLTKHMHVHTGVKPHKCDICGLTFSQNSNLKAHMRIHTGERPYKCDVCGTTFILKSHLKLHMQTHTGAIPYKCDFCGGTFSQKGGLKTHMQVHVTKDRPCKCDVCGATFSVYSKFEIHFRTHIGDKPYNCDICGATYFQIGSFTKHMRTHARDKSLRSDPCETSVSNSGN